MKQIQIKNYVIWKSKKKVNAINTDFFENDKVLCHFTIFIFIKTQLRVSETISALKTIFSF